MNNKTASILVVAIPILISILALMFYMVAWWQLIIPLTYFKGCTACILHSIFYLFTIIFLTGLLFILWAIKKKQEWAYKTIKWILIIASIISLIFLNELVPRLLDYKKVGLNLETWETKELTFSPKERWDLIYKPIVLSFCATCFSVAFLFIWTRERVKSLFINKTLESINVEDI